MIYNNPTPAPNNYSSEDKMYRPDQKVDFFRDTPKVVKNKAVFLALLTLLAISTIGLALLAKNNLDIRGRAASSGSQITMLPAAKNIILGEEFYISVSLNTGPDKVSAVDLKISYDPTSVVLSDFIIKDTLPHALSPFKVTPQTGLISLVLAANPGKPFIGNSVIGTFKVKVINPKNSSITFTSGTKAAAFGKQVDSLILRTGTVLSATTTPLTGGTGSNVLKSTQTVLKSAANAIKSVTLSNTAPSVTAQSLASGSKGVSYSTTLVITKPLKNSKPSITISGLPFGLYKTGCADSSDKLSVVCTISGTPTESGLFGVSVAIETAGQPTVSKTVSLQIK